MESGGFFNAEMLSDGSYDMNYVAEQFAQYFALFVGNGIFVDDVNNLQASSAGGMNVKFNKGAAFWDGYWYINSESLTKVVDINLDASARIDSFVVRFDIAGRKNSIEYKKGDTSVQRADGVYELQLCTIRVDAGSTSITDSNITDTRTNENVCGFVKGLLEVVRTDDLFKQFSDMFNTWFNGVKGILDGDAAGNILGMIGLLDDLRTDDKSSVVAAINEVKQKNDELSDVEDAVLLDVSSPYKNQSCEMTESITKYKKFICELTVLEGKVYIVKTSLHMCDAIVFGKNDGSYCSFDNSITSDSSAYYAQLRIMFNDENTIVFTQVSGTSNWIINRVRIIGVN